MDVEPTSLPSESTIVCDTSDFWPEQNCGLDKNLVC